mmetsp:Transcript_30404/g.48580  ORF Transcript_30404/g.48580 Transcript_30404/m.48580 type:complete len:376 (-) Transcript_30404:1680-2807(-)|eukprot:CAMPEP_0203747212 /NCGR_PEP_ID=MMETSP0098-20131031/2431_1 /ASSEMBLY_ACC=CAM_ASM_000208 /TAXON_ID=96639 /ORGANISM=" , Strain NY0313808BC1" /LENGTH=375 /DNA_ID=CAMNT_0050635577 /DNA_START=1999 /DNA_END=3126 /DNA_ORIENTATION=+
MKVGIVGATGAVGAEIVHVLWERKLEIESVRLFASKRSAGKVLENEFGKIEIEEFAVEKMQGIDVVFLAVSGGFAKANAKKIADLGCLVIDNSSAFRNDDDIPLVIPEINGHMTRGATLIANPNCTTAIAAMALWPLHKEYSLKKIVISTYQAASGAGAEGMEELDRQAIKYGKGETLEHAVFQHQLLFNVIPHIDSFQENGYTREEMKVAWETRKIFGCPELDVSCTAVRTPTLRAHAEAITLETYRPVDVAKARQLIDRATGVKLEDEPGALKYPMPLNASKQYDVEAGRIRESLVFGAYGLDLFVCGDQLLRGAALNAVLIAECALRPDADKTVEKDYSPSFATKLANKQFNLATVLAIAGVASLATYLVKK